MSTPSSSLSVIIPTYNRAHFIGEALRSVLDGVRGDAQIIVVDDGSTDGTSTVLEGFGSRIEVARQANAGIGAARNAGLARAVGIRIAFLDSDDLWTDRHQHALHGALDQRPDVQIAFGWVSEFEDTGDGRNGTPRYAIRKQPGPSCGAMLARRAVFDRIGAFRTDLKVGEFIDWMGRVRDQGIETCMVDEVVLLRRLHGANSVLGQVNGLRDYHTLLRERLARSQEGPRS